MHRHTSRLLFIALGLASSCGAPPATVTLTVLELSADDGCLVRPETPRTTPYLFDLLATDDDGAPTGFAAPVLLRIEGASHFVGATSVYFDVDGPLLSLAQSPASSRVSSFDNWLTEDLDVITTEEVLTMQFEPFITGALATADDRLAIMATVDISGTAFPFRPAFTVEPLTPIEDDDRVAVDVEPTTIQIPVELCRGCLAGPVCEAPAVPHHNRCYVGLDVAPDCERP